MRKCLRCENEMAEDFSIIPSNGVSHIELIKNKDMMSNFKYAVCSKCGYTEIYVNDIQKVEKILQDDTILEPKEKIIVEDLKKYEKYLELEQIKRIQIDKYFQHDDHLLLVGKVVSEKRFSHENSEEKFYIFDIEVERSNGMIDIITVTASERILYNKVIKGENLIIKGHVKTYNCFINTVNKLVLIFFAKEILTKNQLDVEGLEETKRTSNEVSIDGYVCQKPYYRQTPFGREIADILLVVNRARNKSDYIPCIAWGRNARFCQNLEVGTEVKIVGEIRSNIGKIEYKDGTVEQRTAYSISIENIQIINE